MRKILFFILICLAIVQTNAVTLIETQNIKGLDEVSIQGTWMVYESSQPGSVGIIKNLSFDGDATSTITQTSWSGEETLVIHYYFISSCQTDNYVLHLIGNPMDYGRSMQGQKQFLIKNFIDDTMVLTNFAGTYTIKLRKENTYSASINADDKEADDRMFNLNGQEIVTPQGVYIQNGVKKIAK